MNRVEIRDQLVQLEAERVELVHQKQALEDRLGEFDIKLAKRQAEIRALDLPDNESYRRWLDEKEKILAEKRALNEQKRQLEHRISRIALRRQELSNKEFGILEKERLILCPACKADGQKVSMQQIGLSQLVCPSGHHFELVQVE